MGITERAQIINATNMVVMFVGNQDSVNASQICMRPAALLNRAIAMEVDRRHLLTEVRTAIHKEIGALCLDESSTTSTMITRIGTLTNRALATNHGDATTGASAKESYLHLLKVNG